MNTKQKEIAQALESLVHQRFNMETLKDAINKIFGEEIQLEFGYDDVNEFADWNLMFCCNKPIISGDFDIYILKHKQKDFQGNTMYVTEVGYSFDEYSEDEVRSLLRKIKKVKQKQDEQQKIDALKQQQQMLNYTKHFLMYANRAEKLIVLGKELLKNNMPLGKTIRKYNDYFVEFVSEGIYHKFGFILKDNNIVGLGYKGGGICGNSLIFGTKGLIEFSDYFFKTKSLKEIDIDLSNFETNFIDYIKNL